MSVLVYDGDCDFCARCVEWLRRRGLHADVTVAWQHANLPGLGLTKQQCQQAVQLVQPHTGRRYSAHVAIGRLLLDGPWSWRPAGVLLLTPPVRQLAGLLYRWIARNRLRMPGGPSTCGLRPPRT